MCDFETDGEFIDVPTAHIWGRNDKEYPSFGPVLSRLCMENTKSMYILEGGHKILGTREREAVENRVRFIRRTVEWTSSPAKSGNLSLKSPIKA